MINSFPDDRLRVAPGDGSWTAFYPGTHPGGPLSFQLGADELLRDCQCHVDDVTDSSGVATVARCCRRGITALVTQAGYYPFGRQIKFTAHTFHAARHFRRVVDVSWPKGAVVRRHFGFDGLALPGTWTRLFVLPPALHLAEGQAPAWQAIPAAPAAGQELMIGHWHRPPLALVFERPDGTRLEIGTGSDLWRWESGLGAGPEHASFKLFLGAAGLRLAREPLMTCAEFAPAGRDYRFSWYAAWQPAGDPVPDTAPANLQPLPFRDNGDALLSAAAPAGQGGKGRRPKKPAAPPAAPCFLVDFNALPGLPPEVRRTPSPAAYGRGERGPGLCWESGIVQKRARRLIRQLAGLRAPAGTLVFRGLEPGPCWDPAHLDKQNPNGQAHWDINGILDFAEWTRQTLGPAWTLLAEFAPGTPLRPVLAGLFAPAAFAPNLTLPDPDAPEPGAA